MAGLSPADLRFNIAKLVPGTNGMATLWQDYINRVSGGAVQGYQERVASGAVYGALVNNVLLFAAILAIFCGAADCTTGAVMAIEALPALSPKPSSPKALPRLSSKLDWVTSIRPARLLT